jgi:subtilisin family serine protease
MKSFPQELTHGSGSVMTLDRARLLLAFKETPVRDEIGRQIDDLGLVFEDVSQELRIDRCARVWVHSRDFRSIHQELLDALQNRLAAALDWIGPVYRNGPGRERPGLLCPLPNVLLLKPIQQASEETLNTFVRVLYQYGLKEVPEKSAYLGDYVYCIVTDLSNSNAYYLQDLLLRERNEIIDEAHFENMPMLLPYTDVTLAPNDLFFTQQWNLARIGADRWWGLTRQFNPPPVTIAIIDSGCDLINQPDILYAGQGINLASMLPTGAPSGPPTFAFNHGTLCAGVAAAITNNTRGIAGVAGSFPILPIAFQAVTDAEVVQGINYAVANGARVISMSFGQIDDATRTWNFNLIKIAIFTAWGNGCVLVAASGNNDSSNMHFPAKYKLVIAVGGSDTNDNRKTPASPDGTLIGGRPWGANYGPEISVVAPCVAIPATDINNGFVTDFRGTSAAAPHVAGLAALLFSRYPSLSNDQVRDIIERTAEKVGRFVFVPGGGSVGIGSYFYFDDPDHRNGTWNQETGYGRISMFRALDFADVLIKDWPDDDGAEPSAPPGGDFWSSSDIVVRHRDDNVFDPGTPSSFFGSIERGHDNYIYVRITNNGPNVARGVSAFLRVTPYVGLEFDYNDWIVEDATHIVPAGAGESFASILPGHSVIAKFVLSRKQVETVWGAGWNPSLLARVTAQNDYAFQTASLQAGGIVVRRNNLAQRNVSVISIDWGVRGRPIAFPLLAGHLRNASRYMEIVIDRSRLPETMSLLLALDEEGRAFPSVDLRPTAMPMEQDQAGIVFLERTRIEATLGGFRGMLTLEKDSRFGCAPTMKIGDASVQGGEVILRDNKRFVEVREKIAVVRVEKQPNRQYPLALHSTIPAEANQGDAFTIGIAQRNERGQTVGGATVIYAVNSGFGSQNE